MVRNWLLGVAVLFIAVCRLLVTITRLELVNMCTTLGRRWTGRGSYMCGHHRFMVPTWEPTVAIKVYPRLHRVSIWLGTDWPLRVIGSHWVSGCDMFAAEQLRTTPPRV